MRCFEVIDRLCSAAFSTPRQEGQPQILTQFPDSLFGDASFGAGFADIDQEFNGGGMDFSEWINFTPQGGLG